MTTELRSADVNNGLCATYKTNDGSQLMIDCGAQRRKELRAAAELSTSNPNTLFLTHFHLDHYNGLSVFDRLLSAGLVKRLRTDTICLPGIPRFGLEPTLGYTFFSALLALQVATLGSNETSARADLIAMGDRVCKNKPRFFALSRGDVIYQHGEPLVVLWPLKVVTGSRLRGRASTLLEQFQKLKTKNPSLSEAFEQTSRIFNRAQQRLEATSDRLPFEDNISTDQIEKDLEESSIGEAETDEVKDKSAEKDLTVGKLERAFRQVANSLSLSFSIPSDLLCLGDLADANIQQALSDHPYIDSYSYRYLLTAHHGTHWSNHLMNDSFGYTCSSVGSLRNKIKPGYKIRALVHLITAFDGDIKVPSNRWWA